MAGNAFWRWSLAGALAALAMTWGATAAWGQANGLCQDVTSHTPLFMYESLQGSAGSGAGAQSYELDNSLSWDVAKRFTLVGGVPVYFTRGTTGTSGAQERVNVTGMGDSFVTLNFKPKLSGLQWLTCVTGFAPTGNSDLGLGTGRTLFNWNNHLELDFDHWAPYADLGLANTTIARRVLKRPYTTLGKVANVDAGAQFPLAGALTLDVSGYADIPSGPQKIYSRVRIKSGKAGTAATGGATAAKTPAYKLEHVTIGGPSLDRDNGVTAALDLQPRPYLDLGLGYTRSVYQSENIVSFSLGINVSDLIAVAVK